ncbi:hypothetical protein [Dongia deserti]|uniref:hypothetical protein n=1 Tax=Dongia deserti TaxID=2268030 RepID=UPI000E64D78E|nr:hypothetical protein [Dongia deserti]
MVVPFQGWFGGSMNEGVIALAPARFSIGGALGDSLRIFGRNFVSFGVLAMVLQSPWLLAPLIDDGIPTSAPADFDWSSEVFRPLLGLLCAAFTQAAIVLGVRQNLRGRKATMGDTMRGLPFVIPIVAASAICYLPSFMPAIVEHGLRAPTLVVGAASLVFGILYFVLLVICWITAPVIAIEKAGPIAGLARAMELSKGCRWTIFGLLLILGAALFCIMIPAWALGGVDRSGFLLSGPSAVVGFAAYVGSALFSAFNAVAMTVTYHRIRAEKEGAGVEDVADIFD